MLRTVLTASLVCFCTSAFAHDLLADGEPVPTWVKRQCCGVSDAHHLRPEQIHVVPGGYRFDGYDSIVAEQRILPSPDGAAWIFYRTYPDGSQSTLYCAFLGRNSF